MAVILPIHHQVTSDTFEKSNIYCELSKLVVGNLHTGKTTVVCKAHTSMQQPQNTHGHPYLSPDLRWLVYNSDRSDARRSMWHRYLLI